MLLRSPALGVLLLLALAPGGQPSTSAVPAKTSAGDQKKEATEKKEGLPLKPTRKVQFTTDEATWLSLDVSPDGNTILFELLGDLYTLPIAGGEAKRITQGMAFDSQPLYSLDGKSIVFITDRDGADNVWIAGPDGSDPKQLSKDKQSIFASPSWTPDGQYIVVSRQTQLPWGAFELWMYHRKGGGGVQITKAKPKPDARPDEWFNAVGPVASSDGRHLYYTRRDKWFNPYNVTYPLSQIVRRDRVTGDEDTITEAPGSAIRPLLSPMARGSCTGHGMRPRPACASASWRPARNAGSSTP